MYWIDHVGVFQIFVLNIVEFVVINSYVLLYFWNRIVLLVFGGKCLDIYEYLFFNIKSVIYPYSTKCHCADCRNHTTSASMQIWLQMVKL
jgi:hypothetical protein